MRQILIVFLKDTAFNSTHTSAAQWHYNQPDSDQLRLKILGSGSLIVYRLDPENGAVQAHLGGERAAEVAFFPAGGWSGYAWEPVDEAQLAAAMAGARGIAIPR